MVEETKESETSYETKINKYIVNIRNYLSNKSYEIDENNFESFINLLFPDEQINAETNPQTKEELNEILKRAESQLNLQISTLTPTLPKNYTDIYININELNLSNKNYSNNFQYFIENINKYFPPAVIKQIEFSYLFMNKLKDEKENEENEKKIMEDINKIKDDDIKSEMTPEFENYIKELKLDDNKRKLLERLYFLFNNLLKDLSLIKPDYISNGGNKDIPIKVITDVLEQKAKLESKILENEFIESEKINSQSKSQS